MPWGESGRLLGDLNWGMELEDKVLEAMCEKISEPDSLSCRNSKI